MNKHWFLALFVLLALMMFNFTQDQKRQCDGKTKIFATMGKTYPCNNYKEQAND